MHSRLLLRSALKIQFWQLFGQAGVLIPLCIISGCSHHLKEREMDRNSHVSRSPLFSKPIRKIYPFSLIPGGVENAAAFNTYRVSNDVLLRHFRDMGRSIRETALVKDKWMYSSYRIGEKVYWTKNRILVHAGEALLTDGTALVRARCGNRISEYPQHPIQAVEPTSLTTDSFSMEIAVQTPPDLTPQVEVVAPMNFPEIMPPAPIDTSSVPVPPQTPGIEIPPQSIPLPPDTSPSEVFFPPTPFPPIVAPTPRTHGFSPPPEVPTIPTPEVSSWALMLTGLIALGLAFLRRTRIKQLK